MRPGKVLLLPPKLASNGHGTLAFQEANDRGHRMLGRDLHTHVDMIGQQMPFHDPTFFLPSEFMKDPPQARADLAIDRFAPILGHEHHVLLALPARMRQALPRFHHPVLLRICQQAILGGLYSRIAQSSSCRPSRTRGLPPLTSYTDSFLLGVIGMFLEEGQNILKLSKALTSFSYFFPLLSLSLF